MTAHRYRRASERLLSGTDRPLVNDVDAAAALYETFGFAPIGTVPGPDGLRAVTDLWYGRTDQP